MGAKSTEEEAGETLHPRATAQEAIAVRHRRDRRRVRGKG